PKGSVVGRPETPTPSSSQSIPRENVDMPDAPPISELRETLRVKLPDTYSGNRKELEVFLLQVELYSHFNDDKFPTNESYALWTSSYLRGEALRWVEPFLKDYFLHEETCGAMATTKNIHYKRGLKSNVRMELARMENQPKDMTSLIEHTVKIDNRLYEFQKERRTHDNPRKSYKYRGNEGRKRDHHPRDNRWSDPMELDATFKQGNRPRNPDKERQFKERLCFNCNKPGHLARDCKQPKKGNGGQTQAAEAQGRSKRETLQGATARPVEIMKESILRGSGGNPVPKAPARWPGTKQDWEVEVRAVRCRPGYPQHLEPRGAKYMELEATNWLKYKIAEYYAQDAQQEEEQGPEPWELRADRAAMDYEPTDKDVEDLREIMEGTHFANEKEGEELEQRNVAEIDHPWHQYIEWDRCYSGLCRVHYPQKEKNQHFPASQLPTTPVKKLGVLDGRPPPSDTKRPSTNQLCATMGSMQLYVVAKVQKRHLRAMIDSGATGNFMTKRVADTQGFRTQTKAKPYPLMVVDGEPISSNDGMVTLETVLLEMVMLRGHKETIQFDIVHMDNHACILGVP
ncbi:hypothetical protein V493_00324, partial [Pseudogymnoascus sp. VKM F-4281 (FW-2241)]